MHKVWNKFYKDNGRFYLLPHPYLQALIEEFKTAEVFKILDIGCGTGRHLVPLAENDFLVTGIDYSPSAAQLAEEWLNEKDLQGKVYVGDYLNNLDNFQKEEFDAVISINTFQYLESEYQLEEIIEKVYNLLKPSGHIFLVLPSEHTLILQPDIPQTFFHKDIITPLVSSRFKIAVMEKDDDSSWMIHAIKSDRSSENQS